MFFLGLFMTGEFATVEDRRSPTSTSSRSRPWATRYDAEAALDAPIDIWMMSAKSPDPPADMANAKAYLAFWAKGTTQVLMYKANNGFIPTANDADTSTYDS